jgi:probable rRNA maturation factor
MSGADLAQAADIEVEVEDPAWTTALIDVEAIVIRAARAALMSADAAGAALVVLLADDEAVKALNGQFRGRDRPTNVLSFPAPQTARPHVGDVVLAYGVCAAEAVAQGKTLADHLSHLVAHGVLHLMGHDHEVEAEAEEMEAQERTILAGLGIADPYLCRDDA